MLNQNIWRGPVSSVLVVAIFCATLAGCGVFVTLHAESNYKSFGNDSRDHPDLAIDPFLVEMAKDFGLMALFAEVVYRRDISDIPEGRRDALGCAYLGTGMKESPYARFGMPHGKDPKMSHWERWIPTPDELDDSTFKVCENKSGLYYETYIHLRDDGKIDEAVIAYRGTENREGQYWNDWSANAISALGLEPGEYKLAADRLIPLVSAIQTLFARDQTNGKIYAVGHSLGGGLAQQAGYLSRGISEVYTFNTSPVTNWSHLSRQGKVRNAWPIIHRIYHGGEFLENVRFVSTSTTPARFGRHDIGLQLEGRSNFGGHSMKVITCNFAEILSKQTVVGAVDHDYSLTYVRDEVLRQERHSGDVELVCLKEK